MLLDESRTMRRYAQIVQTFARFGSYVFEPMFDVLLEAMFYVVRDHRKEDRGKDSLDIPLLGVVCVRGLLTGVLVLKLPSAALGIGLPGAAALALALVRFPRFPVAACAASALVVFRTSPEIGGIVLARLGLEVGRAVYLAELSPGSLAQNPRLLRSSALVRRAKDRKDFFAELADQTQEAWDLARSPKWNRARLSDDERGGVFGLARLSAIGRLPAGLPRADPDEPDDSDPVEERLGDLLEQAALDRRFRRFLVSLAFAAGSLAATAAAAIPFGPDRLQLPRVGPLAVRLEGPRLAVALGVLSAGLVQAIHTELDRRLLRERQSGSTANRLLVLALLVGCFLARFPFAATTAVVAVAVEGVVLDLRNRAGGSGAPRVRTSTLVMPWRLGLTVDAWFALRQARASYDDTATESLRLLRSRYERRRMSEEVAWTTAQIARVARQAGDLQGSLDALDAPSRGSRRGAGAALLELERGLTERLTSDPATARQRLLRAAHAFARRRDPLPLCEALNAIAGIEVERGDLDAAMRCAGRARSVASLAGADQILLENELTIVELLTAQGRDDDAEQAARDAAELAIEPLKHAPGLRVPRLLGFAEIADLRTTLIVARAQNALAAAHLGAGRYEEAIADAQDAVGLLSTLPSLDAAESHRILALARFRASGPSEEALDEALAALAILSHERHRLASQPDRARWFDRHRSVLDVGLRLASGLGQHMTVAELIEVARTQAVPRPGPESGAAVQRLRRSMGEHGGDGLRSAASTSVALEAIGALPLSPPPMIQVRGRSALMERSAPRRRADTAVDLEAASLAAGGPEGIWLGYWASGTELYWAVVPPTGEVTSGRTSLACSTLAHEALEQLRAALPIRLPGEAREAMSRRVKAGPLGGAGDRGEERRLAELLGQALIPPPLAQVLRDRRLAGAEPALVTISPAAELANVPWPLLLLPGGREAGGGRFHELADWRIAPSAALLDVISRRRLADTAPPVRIAVLDPSGERPDGGDSGSEDDLNQARDAIRVLSPDALALTGRWDASAHGSTRRLATLANLATVLEQNEEPATMLVAAHCETPAADRSAASGVAMAGTTAGTYDVLSAFDLLVGRTIDGEHRRFRLPERLIVAACDSAGASSVAFGEWLSFGPAALFAGTDVMVVTQFPIPDSSSVEQALIRELGHDRSLRHALRSVLMRHLADWDAGVGAAPLTWCGYALLGRWEPG